MSAGTLSRSFTVKTWLALAAACVAFIAMTPLGFIAWVAFETGWSTGVSLIFRARVGELLISTALLVAITVPLTAVVGVGFAWLIERTDLPGRQIWSWLAVAPLAIPAFVHSYAWVTLFPGMKGLGAGVLISVLAYFPFTYLPVTAALRRLDPAWEETASSMGLTRARVFLRVVVPELRLALCGGSLLVGLHLLAEYGLYAMIRFDTFTTAIVDQFQSSYNGPAANMLGGVLVFCCVGLLMLEAWIRGDRRYARLGPGAARRPRSIKLGLLTLPCLAVVAGIIGVSIGVPLYTLIGWLIKGGAHIWRWDEILPTFGETILLAVAGALVATLASFPTAYLAARSPGRTINVFESSHYFVGSLPGVIVALAIVTISAHALPSIYQTVFSLIAAYAIIFLPRAFVSVKASTAQVPAALEEAASSLGRTPLRTLIEVTLRLASPGIASSFALVSLGITNELTATLMLSPNGTQTLATLFWAYTSEIDYAAAAPYGLMMILLSLPMMILLRLQSAKAAGL